MKKIHFVSRIFLLLLLASVSSGCIRFAAKAAYTHQGSKEESPRTKTVGIDTEDLVHPDRARGNITT